MRIYWWQGGVFLHPEKRSESRSLLDLTNSIERGLTSQTMSHAAKVISAAKAGGADLAVPPKLVEDEGETEET